MGVGMVVLVTPDAANTAVSALAAAGVPAWVGGEVLAGGGGATLTGSHRG